MGASREREGLEDRMASVQLNSILARETCRKQNQYHGGKEEEEIEKGLKMVWHTFGFGHFSFLGLAIYWDY